MKDLVIFKKEDSNLFFQLSNVDTENIIIIIEDKVKTPASILEWKHADDISHFELEKNCQYLLLTKNSFGEKSIRLIYTSEEEISQLSAEDKNYTLVAFAKLNFPLLFDGETLGLLDNLIEDKEK